MAVFNNQLGKFLKMLTVSTCEGAWASCSLIVRITNPDHCQDHPSRTPPTNGNAW